MQQKAGLMITRGAQRPADFERWLGASNVDDHPFFGEFGRRYYPLAFGDTRRNESFAVLKDGTPRCLVLCTVGGGVIDYFGQPVSMFGNGDWMETASAEISAAIDHLIELAKPSSRLTIADFYDGQASSAISMECRRRGFVPAEITNGLCDLTFDEAHLRRALRKSYRSLVNWGKKNLRTEYINIENRSRERFELYRDFHLRVAGRRTRPQSTWDVMFEWIAAGQGELSLGFLEGGDLVAGTMVIDGKAVAYYASGVYDRERFDKPVGHWPIFNAILRSKARGRRWFDVGWIPQKETVSDKEYAIGFFKKGFITELRGLTSWEYRSNGR